MATFKVALLALFLAFSATFLSVFSTSSPESHQQQDWLKEAVSEVESSAAYSSSETVEVSYKCLKKIIKYEKAFSKYQSMQFPLCHHPHLIFYFTVYTISTNVETMGKHEMSPRRCTTHKFCVVVFLLTLCKQCRQKVVDSRTPRFEYTKTH